MKDHYQMPETLRRWWRSFTGSRRSLPRCIRSVSRPSNCKQL